MQPTKVAPEAWRTALQGVIGDLEALNEGTERSFAAIGGRLTNFLQSINLISSELKDLGALISGDGSTTASRALTSALVLSDQMNGRAGETNRLLDRMCAESARLKEALSRSSGMVSTFQCLGLLTRIETARLGSASADFGSLADDVKVLTQDVQTKVESALETAADLIPRVEVALRDVSAIQREQLKDLPIVVSKAQDSLSLFDDMQVAALETSARLESRSAEISDSFKRIVISIQFQDITRQQVEHVISALKDLVAWPADADAGEARHGRTRAAVMELQSLQLGDAAEKFASSTMSVLRALDEIAGHVQTMAAESRTLSGFGPPGSGPSSSDQVSLLGSLERDCSAILDSIVFSGNAEEDTRVTAKRLAENIRSMTESIRQIRTIETQMEQIAMNARISASRLGQAGQALSALADATKHLVFESQTATTALVETLSIMEEAVTRLCAHNSDGSEDRKKRDESLATMRSAFADLRTCGERGQTQINRITDLGGRMARDLDTLRRNFSIGELFAESVRSARQTLQQTGDAAKALLADTEEAKNFDLAEFAARYTMHAERAIHEGLGKDASPASLLEVTADNVEFF